MATLTCTTSTKGSSYSCSGIFCGRKIARLKAADAANPNSPANLPIADFKVLQTQPGKDDSILVGMRSFSVHKYDIIIIELPDDIAEVIVFKGDTIAFRNKRPKQRVKYVVGQNCQLPVFEAFDEEEDFVRLDINDFEKRFLKNTGSKQSC